MERPYQHPNNRAPEPDDLSVRSWVLSDPDMHGDWPVDLRTTTVRRYYVDWKRTWAQVKRIPCPSTPSAAEFRKAVNAAREEIGAVGGPMR